MDHRTSQPASTVIGQQKANRLHHFDDGDEVIAVRTTKQPNGEYTAIDHENYDYDSPVGWGVSEIGAIADLFEKLPRANSEREERNDLAARFDHAQDQRKNYEAV